MNYIPDLLSSDKLSTYSRCQIEFIFDIRRIQSIRMSLVREKSKLTDNKNNSELSINEQINNISNKILTISDEINNKIDRYVLSFNKPFPSN